MLRGLAAIGWNANGHADWLFLLVKWSGICQTGGDQCACNCSLVVTHAFTLEGFIWENSVFILRCVKFVHQNPRESITTDSQSISGCLKWMYHSGFLSFLSGGSGDSECGASEFTLMLVWYQFVHLETAGAFLFLEYVGMKLCWPEEKKQKKAKLHVKLFNLSHCWRFPSDFFDLPLTKESRLSDKKLQDKKQIQVFRWSFLELLQSHPVLGVGYVSLCFIIK